MSMQTTYNLPNAATYSPIYPELNNYTIVDPFLNGSIPLTREDLKKRSMKKVNHPSVIWKGYYTRDRTGKIQVHIATNLEIIEATYCFNDHSFYEFFFLMADNNGQSALHHAVLRHRATTVRQLILCGADPAVSDSIGNTALHLACAFGDLDCARALLHPFTPAEHLMLTTRSRLPPFPQNLRIRNKDGNMCHHIAVAKGHIELVRRLKGCGADMAASDRDGNTALHIAIATHQRDMVTMLLHQPGYNLNIMNRTKESAYDFAIRFKEYEIAEKLEKLGACGSTDPRLHRFYDINSEYVDEEFDIRYHY